MSTNYFKLIEFFRGDTQSISIVVFSLQCCGNTACSSILRHVWLGAVGGTALLCVTAGERQYLQFGLACLAVLPYMGEPGSWCTAMFNPIRMNDPLDIWWYMWHWDILGCFPHVISSGLSSQSKSPGKTNCLAFLQWSRGIGIDNLGCSGLMAWCLWQLKILLHLTQKTTYTPYTFILT